MNACRHLFSLIAFIAMATNVFAHSPFDCSTRALVHPDSVEVVVTAGADLAEQFLAGEGASPRQMSVAGRPKALSAAIAEKLVEVTADGKILSPQSADVSTDGMEFQFRVLYPLTFARSLTVHPRYLNSLPPPKTSSFVLTDEVGNILGSALVTPGHEPPEFQLSAKLFAAADPDAMVISNGFSQSSPPAAVTPVDDGEKINPLAPPRPGFMEFLRLGIGHILNLGAFDHLLFLTALLLGCRRLKPMLLVITGFTLAHSLTLALAALNLVTISPRLIEPAIAASIIFVAAENFRRTEKSWPRYALTCGFGLIHGFGFASALRTSGLAGTGLQIAGPLVAFNLGVEIGQLIVAAVLLPLLLLLNQWSWFAKNGVRLISAFVILVATFWLWQRLAA